MEPASWIALAGVAVAVVGATVSTVAAVEQAEQQEKQAKAESKYLFAKADMERDNAAFQERQFRRRAALEISKNNAVAGAAGLDISSGSPLLNELDFTTQAELEALNIKRGGDIAAASREFEGRAAAYRAGNYRSQGGYAMAAGATSAGGSVLSYWSKTQKPATYSSLSDSYMRNREAY
jgi:hypothetical protein